MSTPNTKLKWTKVAAGSYDAVTGLGEHDRYEVTLCAGTFAYSQQGWFLVYPGNTTPDSVFTTLREAKAAAQVWHDIDVAILTAAADDEDFHCCDADEDLDYGNYDPWSTVTCAGCGAEMEYSGDGTTNVRSDWAPIIPVRRP